MRGGTLAVLLGGLFGLGFLGVRIASGPSQSEAAPTAEKRENPESKSSRTREDRGGRIAGFAAAVERLASTEEDFQGEDFESLMDGPTARSAADKWARTDPEGLFLWFQENEDTDLWRGVYRPLFSTWFQRDPDAAIEAFRMLSGDLHAREGLIDLLFSDDPAVARAAGERAHEFFGIDALPDGDSGTPRWFYDGEPTLNKILALPENRAKPDLIRSAMAGWASKDWKAARAWAEARPEAERNAMLQSMFAWGIPDPMVAGAEGQAWIAEFFSRDENRDLRIRWGGSYATLLSRKEPAAAVTWASENLSGAALVTAMSWIVTTRARRDLEAAIAMVDSLPPGGVHREAGRELIVAMLSPDPWAGYDRAREVAGNGFDVGEQLWGGIGTSLARSDPERARALLADPPENVPSIFHSCIIGQLSLDHAEETVKWAAQNLEGAIRTEAIELPMRYWRAYDPEAAEKWERERGDE